MTDHDDKANAWEQLVAADAPKEGEVWRHYKGGLYTVKMTGLQEDTLEPVVGYVSQTYGFNFFRKLSVWEEMVEHEGRTVPRFQRVGVEE